jgi:hypothetical protein
VSLQSRSTIALIAPILARVVSSLAPQMAALEGRPRVEGWPCQWPSVLALL